MREYGKVQTEFWEHPGVRRLSTEARLLYLYLLTGPHTTMVGCFKAPRGYVADDLGWVSETVSERFGELSREGFVTYDETTRYVLVHGFLKFNRIVNRNIAVPMMEWFREVPNHSPLKPTLAAEIVEFVDKIDDPMRAELEPFLKPFRERYPNPENREQGTEEDIGSSASNISVHEIAAEAANDDVSASTALVLSGEPSKPKRAKTKPEPTAAEQAEFDAFWSVYPRKAGKQPAMLAYIDVVRAGAKPEDIFVGAQLYAGLRQGQDPTHTKMAQGWLNDKRWADEVTETPQGGYRDHIGARRGTWDPMEQAVAGIGWNEDAA